MNRLKKYKLMTPSQLNTQHEKALNDKFTVFNVKGVWISLADISKATFKDFVDTFKPYKSRFQRYHDVFQGFYGVAHLLIGTSGVVFASFYAVVGLPIHAYQKLNGNFDGSIIATYFTNLAAMTALGVANLLRGCTQIATMPLAWLRIPLRLAITKFKGEPLIENTKSLHELAVLAASSNLDATSHAVIHRTILHKCMKAVSLGQKTNIAEIRDCKKNQRINYRIFLKPDSVSVAPAAVDAANSAPGILNR